MNHIMRRDRLNVNRFKIHKIFLASIVIFCIPVVVWALTIGPASMTVTMEWGTTDVVTQGFYVKPSRTIGGEVTFKGIPKNLDISLDPDSEVHTIYEDWVVGQQYDHTIYLTEPRFWVPDGGYVKIEYVAGEVPDDGGGGIGGYLAVCGFLKLYLTNVPPDTIKPQTEVRLSGLWNEGGWYDSDVRVFFEPNDDFSGIDKVFYRILPEVSWSEGKETTLDSPGMYDIEYYALDRAGNSEARKVIHVAVKHYIIKPEFFDSGQRLGNDKTYKLKTGDLNGDSFPDLVVCNFGSPYGNWAATQVYFNNGLGMLQNSGQSLGKQSPDGCSRNMDCVVGDLDNDNDLDIVLADSGFAWIYGGLNIYENDGLGTFDRIGRLIHSSVEACEIVDVNRDGLPDLIAGSRRNDLDGVPGEDSVFLNQGSLNFIRGAQFNSKENGQRTNNIKTGQFNDDEYPDLAVSIKYYCTKIFFNDPNGVFTDENAIETAFIGPDYFDWDMGAEDMNQDGQTDLLNTHILLLNKEGKFEDANSIIEGPIAVGDINLDGIPDVLAGNKIMLGVGNGYFASGGELSDPNGYPMIKDVELCDLELDGDLDVLVAWANGEIGHGPHIGPIYIYMNNLISPAGDIDGDLDVDITDLSIIAGKYLDNGCDYEFVDNNVEFLNADNDCWLDWGDYDNDGDLDMAVSGRLRRSPWHATKIYRNEGDDIFTDINVSIDVWGWITWFDYDNDGDLDITLSGNDDIGIVCKIYRNDGNETFIDIGVRLTGSGPIDWGDYDNDGDPDLAVTAYHKPRTKIYRNDLNNVFTDIEANIPAISFGTLSWGDYDNDEDLDLAVSGKWGAAGYTRIYRNDEGIFTPGPRLKALDFSSLDWGDYDADGDLDIALTGYNVVVQSYIYRNNGNGTFTDIDADLEPAHRNSIDWGDYDNDGDLDLAIAGTYKTIIYRNDDGIFTDANAGLDDMVTTGTICGLSWGDYDNDGDLDLVVGGESHPVKIYRNDCHYRLGDINENCVVNLFDYALFALSWLEGTIH